MRIIEMKIFDEHGIEILISDKDYSFPIKIITIFFPTFKIGDKFSDSYFKIGFDNNFYIRKDMESFVISVKIFGFGLQYSHQWAY